MGAKLLNARPGNCVCFLTGEQGSRREEDVSIVQCLLFSSFLLHKEYYVVLSE